MPAGAQNDIAQAMVEPAGIGTQASIDASDRDDVLAGLAAISRGDIASDAEVDAAFRRFTP